MLLNEKDCRYINNILKYCDKLHSYIAKYGNSFESFKHNEDYQDLCILAFIQIGESVNMLSDSFTNQYSDIDWKSIYGLRCFLVHGYENLSIEILWDTITQDLPQLISFCKNILKNRQELS